MAASKAPATKREVELGWRGVFSQGQQKPRRLKKCHMLQNSIIR